MSEASTREVVSVEAIVWAADAEAAVASGGWVAAEAWAIRPAAKTAVLRAELGTVIASSGGAR